MDKLRLDFYLSVGGKLSAGDEIIDSCGCSNIINERTVDYWTERDKSDKDRFITSFAERKNKGEQPVHDDFPVIVFVSGGNCSASVASMEEWMHCGRQSIQSWKPDYEALLKIQAEHDKHNKSIIKACDEANRKESEMVYTQEMKDNGELPKVGMKCEVKYSGGGTFSNAIIKFISDYGAVHADAETGVEIFCGSIHALDINPYKTPEQIELEEAKKKQVLVMSDRYRYTYNNRGGVSELIKAMQENGDLPEIVIDDLSARGMAKE